MFGDDHCLPKVPQNVITLPLIVKSCGLNEHRANYCEADDAVSKKGVSVQDRDLQEGIKETKHWRA